MGDTYWMEDIVRVNWEEVRPINPFSGKKSPLLDNLIEDFIFQNAQYPFSEGGGTLRCEVYVSGGRQWHQS